MSNNPCYKIVNLSFRAALILMAFTSVAGSASAAVILSTDFTGRIIANNTTTTATNVIWTANGVSNPGTSLSTSGDFLLDTAATAGYFTPNANVGGADPWDASFSFTVTDSTIQLGSIVLVVNQFNSLGTLSPSLRDTRYIVRVTGSISGQIASNTLDTPQFTASLGEGPKTLSFNYDTPLVLNASETYTVRIDSRRAITAGVYSGIDSITLNSIPEPTLPSLLGVFGVLLLLRRRR